MQGRGITVILVMYLVTLCQKYVWKSGGVAVCILIHVLAGVRAQLHEQMSVHSEIGKQYSLGRKLADPAANMDAAEGKTSYR
jgi:hypothetical protein